MGSTLERAERTAGPPRPRVVDAGPARTLLHDPSSDPPSARKRFHAPGPAALFDRHRARREAAWLRRLAERGLPVPRLLGLARCAGGWELSMVWVEAARPLAELLEERRRGGTAPAGGWERLCARLGRLLARLQAEGIEHRDPHPGNVLVDAAGAPWLVDLRALRRVHHGRARLERMLARLAGATREVLPARERARFFVAWRRALPPALACLVPPSAALAPALELRARRERRAAVERHLDRWERPSSRARLVADGALLARRDVCEEAALGARDEPALLVLHGPPDELLRRWENAARLFEHRVPALVPFARPSGRAPAWAAFERPRGAAPEAGGAVPAPPAPDPQALARLLGRLHDRGLAPDPLRAQDVERTADGDALLRPPRVLHPLDPRAATDATRHAALAGLVPEEARTAAFHAAYASGREV